MFIGAVAGNLVAEYIKPLSDLNPAIVWIVFILAFVAAIAEKFFGDKLESIITENKNKRSTATAERRIPSDKNIREFRDPPSRILFFLGLSFLLMSILAIITLLTVFIFNQPIPSIAVLIVSTVGVLTLILVIRRSLYSDWLDLLVTEFGCGCYGFIIFIMAIGLSGIFIIRILIGETSPFGKYIENIIGDFYLNRGLIISQVALSIAFAIALSMALIKPLYVLMALILRKNDDE